MYKDNKMRAGIIYKFLLFVLIFILLLPLQNRTNAQCGGATYCGTGICWNGATSILCCTSSNPYPDICNGQPRSCTTPECPPQPSGNECTIAADCPNGSIQQQCGGKACNVAKACTNGYCTYTCSGIPPCAPGGATSTPSAPTPTPYPTTAVSGGLQYRPGIGVCPALNYPATAPVPTIVLYPSSPTGVTSSCVANLVAATYQCNVSYNNAAYPSIPLSQSFTLSSNSFGYGTGNWTVGNVCTGTTDNTRTFAAGQVAPGNNIFFTLISWIKLQDGSLQTPSIDFTIPLTVVPYDSSDLGNRYLIDGVAGVASTSNASFPPSSSVPISQNNFSLTSYSVDTTLKQHMTASNFLSYTRSRKEYSTLTNAPTDLSTITANGIYYYNTGGTPLTITTAPTAKIVLIVDGDATITNNLTQSQGFALLVNGSLSLSTSVTEIHGIFIANSFSTGTVTSGLKIVGNVSDSSFNNGRTQTDNRKPSVFILSNPQYLFDLLPWLNTRKYDWRQLQ